jgi:hypothetical protein
MTVCRTLAEVLAAADRDAAKDPPLSQETADLIAALLTPHRAVLASLRSERDADEAEPRSSSRLVPWPVPHRQPGAWQ